MIRCPKCAADNGVGTLFCSACGARLDLEHVRPELARRPRGNADVLRWLRVAWKLFLLGVILFCIWTLVGFFRQPGASAIPVLTDGERGALEAKTDALFAPYQAAAKHAFTAAELTALADGVLGLPVKLPDGSGVTLVPEHLEVRVTPSGLLCLRLQSRAAGVPLYRSCYFKVAAAEDGGVRCRPEAVMFGTVSLPRFAWPFVLARVQPLLDGCEELRYVKAHALEFCVDGGGGSAEFRLPGTVNPIAASNCPKCKGSGKCANPQCRAGKVSTAFGVRGCTTCRGDGKCLSCKGAGKVNTDGVKSSGKQASIDDAARNKALLSELETVRAARAARKTSAAAVR